LYYEFQLGVATTFLLRCPEEVRNGNGNSWLHYESQSKIGQDN